MERGKAAGIKESIGAAPLEKMPAAVSRLFSARLMTLATVAARVAGLNSAVSLTKRSTAR